MYAQAVGIPLRLRRGEGYSQVLLNSVQKGVHFQMFSVINRSGSFGKEGIISCTSGRSIWLTRSM